MRTELALDAILTLPAGREFDAVVAKKVMEKKVCICHCGDHATRSFSGTCSECHQRIATSYSTSIVAAWEVFEKLCRDHPEYELALSWDGEKWRVLCLNGTDSPPVLGSAPSAPLAIVRAALKAVMG